MDAGQESDTFRDISKALYWLPQPVQLITAAAGERRNVMIATRGMQFRDKPPSLAIGVAAHAVTGELILESREFAINVLASDQTEVLQKARALSRVPSTEVDKFAGFGVETFQGDIVGAPLIAGCAVNFECRVTQVLEATGPDAYYIVIGDVVAMRGSPGRGAMAMYRQACFDLSSPIPGTSR